MTDCGICFNEDYNKIGIVALTCNHEFCLDCIKEIYKKDKKNGFKCPLCRSHQCDLEKIIVNFPDKKQTLSELITIRPQNYFNIIHPYTSHARISDTYIYSFGLRPEISQPSGTFNYYITD